MAVVTFVVHHSIMKYNLFFLSLFLLASMPVAVAQQSTELELNMHHSRL